MAPRSASERRERRGQGAPTDYRGCITCFFMCTSDYMIGYIWIIYIYVYNMSPYLYMDIYIFLWIYLDQFLAWYLFTTAGSSRTGIQIKSKKLTWHVNFKIFCGGLSQPGLTLYFPLSSDTWVSPGNVRCFRYDNKFHMIRYEVIKGY